MRRLAAIAMIAFAASLSAFAAPASAMHGHGMMGMKHKCPAGQHWVKGYHKKNGQKVKGYCR